MKVKTKKKRTVVSVTVLLFFIGQRLARGKTPCLMLTVGALLAVFCLLTGRAAAVCAGDVLLLFSLGLHLTLVGIFALSTATKRNSILKNRLKIILSAHNIYLFD